MKRDLQGKFSQVGYTKTILPFALLLFLILLIVAGNIVNYLSTPIVVEAVQEEVDARDNIQKLADNYAQSYRLLKDAEAQLKDATERHSRAVEAYNVATESLNLYTK